MNAARFEAGGVGYRNVSGSEEWIFIRCRRGWLDHDVAGSVFVEAMDLVAVVRLEERRGHGR